VGAAQGTLGVALRPYFTKDGFARIKIQDAVGEKIADPEDQFQRFCRLNGTDDAGHHADNACFLTAGNEPRRRRMAENAPVAGRLPGQNGKHPAFESKNTAVDEGLARKTAGVIDKEFGGKIIHPVNHDIVGPDTVQRVVGVQAILIRFDYDFGIDQTDFFFRGLDLGLSNIRRVMEDLSLEIGSIHGVVIDDANGSYAGCGQIQGRRRAQPSCADYKYFRLGDFRLSLPSHFGEKDVPTVSCDLLFRKLHGNSRA